ncbi:hypothetical protein HQ585_03325 [candidate division KSB1 bacterium]|nr:hypothetical protein [candidate division KSB1 bacterium]
METDEICAHLRDCPNCSQWASELESAWQMLEADPGAKPSPYFYTRLRARLDSETQSSPWSVRILLPVSATVVLVLGILLGSVIGTNGNGTTALQSQTEWIDGLHLESFDDIQSTSFGAAYFQSTESDNPTEGGAL